MLHKSFELLETKAEGDRGEFTAIVSTFGNIDRVGDRIMPGAWTKTLEDWTASGDPIPIILAHQWNDPMAHIGIADPNNVKQVEQGLQVTGTLDIGDNPVAAQVYKLMKRRSLKEFSIGYDVPKGGEKRAKDGANEISQITLAECGPCLVGIDPKTELQSVKSALETMNLPDAEVQRKEAEKVAREEEEARLPDVPVPEPKAKELTVADLLAEVLPMAEIEGIKSGDLKAVWTVAFINDLPDSAFLYVEPGGSKDADGKTTPRSLRHFPYKDASGAVDLPHLRNALSRIPQSSLPQDVKDRLTAQAQRILDNQKSVDVAGKEPEQVKARSVDPLREQAEAVALEFASDGLSLRRPPKQIEQPRREPEMSISDLKDRMRAEVLVHLSGDIT